LFTTIIASGQTSSGEKYGLMEKFHDNFNPSVENNRESVFAIQMTANDGTNSIANANEGGMLNFPYNSPFRCCGFINRRKTWSMLIRPTLRQDCLIWIIGTAILSNAIWD